VRVTLVADTYTDITTQFEALGDSVKITSTLDDLDVGLVTSGETPTVLPDVDAGAVIVEKTRESTLDVYAYSLLGGDIWLTAHEAQKITGTTGTTSS